MGNAASTRHRWPAEGKKFHTVEAVPYHYKTERCCLRCDMVRVTFHQPAGAWDAHSVEFWRDGDQVECERTPPCDARLERAAAAQQAVPA